MPVSYTHLDVYKRQALGNMDNEHASAHLRYYLEREKDPTVIAAMRNAIAALNKGE